MKIKYLLLIYIIATCIIFSKYSYSFAYGFEELCKNGYAVIDRTSIVGEFNGCEFDKMYKLTNGLYFKCTEFNYSYGYMPEVYILKNIKNGNLKVIINDIEFNGTLYK